MFLFTFLETSRQAYYTSLEAGGLEHQTDVCGSVVKQTLLSQLLGADFC